MIEPREYSHLRGRLTGISDYALDAHLQLYRRKCDELNAIERAYPLTDWSRPMEGQGPPPEGLRQLMGMPVKNLRLKPEGELEACLAQLRQEMRAAGIEFWPGFYLGDDSDFWTDNEGTSISIPWFLASEALDWLVNQRTSHYRWDEVMRILRHEAGHAVCYAFEIWKRRDFTALFGDHVQPYRDSYLADPTSSDYVRYLHRTGEKHYAQKHPDEDFAETFAAWLDPRGAQVPGPAARGKVEFIERLSREGSFSGTPPNQDPGQREPYTKITQTVGDYLGEDRPGAIWSPHAELLRREPAVYNSVVLHEKYFAGLGRETLSAPGPNLSTAAGVSFGSVESWLLDLRAAGAAATGWALGVWDERRGRLMNVLVEGDDRNLLAGQRVLLACDTHEHAYADFGIRKDAGIAAWFENVQWELVETLLGPR